MGPAKTGVGVCGYLGNNWHHPGKLGFYLLQGLHGLRVCTEGAAYSESYSFVEQRKHSFLI